MKRASPHIAVIVVLAGLAIIAAGCSDARMAANNAASSSGQNNGQVRQSNYQVGYGLSSEGTTTDLYTELKGSLQPPERPQATAAVQQGPVQQGSSTGVNGQQVADSAPGTTAQQPAAAVQQPAGPPREQPTATMYGMSSDGPTTDVYTTLFGSRNH